MSHIEEQQYLTFLLAQETYAVSIQQIKEIIEHYQLTAVPMMPDFIRGVINLRGQVVPVIDLLARFGKGQSVAGKRTCIVILEIETDGEQQDIGIMVDAVNEVLDIPTSEIEPPPGFGASIKTDFIKGMGKVEGKFVIVLAADHILSGKEIAQLSVDSVRDEVTI
jgi:purine-binding chemotaxis protein CheW